MGHPILLKNEHELLQLLKVGSEQAFTQIFYHYKGHIYSVALNFLKSPSAAEEIVQEVFLKLWLKRTELAEVKRLDNYLFIMARNLIFDRIKKMGYESVSQIELVRQFTNESNMDDSEYLVRQHECQRLIQQAIERLSPQQKQVYIFAKVEYLSQEIIAERMGISRLTVKTHMAKALQSIRQYLETHLHYLPVLPFVVTLAMAIQSAPKLI